MPIKKKARNSQEDFFDSQQEMLLHLHMIILTKYLILKTLLMVWKFINK
jgi:hypothetical protein